MLLAIDGQAHYNTAQLTRKWAVNSNHATWEIANEGRWSASPCLKRTATSNGIVSGYLERAPLMTQAGVWVPYDTGICGFAFKTLALGRHTGGNPGAIGNNGYLVGWYEFGQIHCCAQLNIDGTISIYAQPIAGAMTLLGTSPGVVSDNTWVYLEFKWVIGEAGSVVVRANGIEVLSVEGLTRTNYGGVDYLGVWTSIRLASIWSSLAPYATCWISDFYLADTTGSGDAIRDFLGDVQVQTIRPNGIGNATQWAPNTGANWAAVDELPAADDDTTYVSSDTPGDRDSYQYTDLPAGAEPLGFQTCLLARKATAGAAAIKATVRSGGSNADGDALGLGATTEYSHYLLQPYDTNPITGDRATAAEINAAEFGAVRA